jgi:hypothetical protein
VIPVQPSGSATPEPLASAPLVPADVPGPHPMAWLLVAGTLIGAAATWRRPRIIVGSALVFLLTVFTFEQALHSVHHGLDPGEGERCAIAAASSHLAGTTIDTITASDIIVPPVEERCHDAGVTRPAVRCPRPAQGRGPPA